MPRGNFHARPPGLIRLPGGHRRLWLLQVIVLGLFVLLVARLWGLQVLASEHYQTPARNDFVRDVVLPAPAGRSSTGPARWWSATRPPGRCWSIPASRA